MLGPYDQHPMFYDKKQRNQFLEWEYPRPMRISLPLALDNEHHEQLILDAANERSVSRFEQGTSWSGRLSFNFGSWLVKAGCRLEKFGFGRLGPQPANAAVAVDCGCA